MPNDNAQQLAKLSQLFNADKLLTTQDVEAILQALIKVLANNKTSVEQMSTETKQQANDLFEKIAQEHYKLQQKVDETVGMSKAEIDAKMAKMMSDCKSLMEECKMAMPKDGMDGKDADEEKIVEDVLKKIKLPEYKDPILDNGEQIVEKINDLEIKPEFQIDAKHIKNLPKPTVGNTALISRGQVQVKDFSSSLDGVTKTFAMPGFDRIVMITSTSFPFTFRPTIDYTIDASAMTITFTSEINEAATLAAGQTLLVLYTTL